MMKHAMAIVGLAGCLISVGLAGTEPLTVPVTAKGPKLDGVLDDACWQTAAKIDTLYLHNSDTPVKDTTVYLARDNKWLFLGFKCVNSNMAHVSQIAFERDGHVEKDDSVEVFVRPESAKKRYYQFKLNFANVTAEQRTADAGSRVEGWTPPWRSSTRRLPQGWTAELAIPLFVFETDDLSGLQINLCRNFMNIELDQMGAKQSEKRVHHALKSGNKGSFHYFSNFLPVSGLGGFKPEIPFAPQITAVSATGYHLENGSNFYGISVKLETGSPVAGKVKVIVVETMGGKDVEKYTESVTLEASIPRQLTLSVPTAGFQDRRVKVLLVEPDNQANVLAAMEIKDTSALRVIKNAFVGRSYYTTEPAAAIRLEFGLSEEMLRKVALVIDVNGKKALETKRLKPVMTPEIPLSALKMGTNAASIRILSEGKELTSTALVIQRLKPRPGFETKLDFIKGIMLKDDKPYFPVGIYGHTLQRRLGLRGSVEDDASIFQYLGQDIGFNTVLSTRSGSLGTNINAFMKLAEKYGMNVITRNAPQPTPPGMKPGTWPPPPVTLPLAERLKIQRAWYEGLEPRIIADTRMFRDYKNFIGYDNVDEPNLLNADERIAAAEWYWNTVTPLDPYRPQFLLYSKHIPQGDNWTRWGQILGYDVYPRPFTPTMYGDPGLSTAYYAYELRERCRQDNKVMWFVPIANNLGPPRSPIGMNKAHMLCQAYTAIIYGSRGLLYFALHITVGEDAWDALKTINAQIKVLAPALLNGDVAQDIRYTPDNFKPAERNFPMVNAAVFKYPDGDYLLMAVNIMPFAVDTTFKVSGLKKTARLFGSKGKIKIKGESFTEKIDGYGVRAYKIKLADNPAPVQVALNMTALEDEKAPSVDVVGIVRQLMLGKNCFPNPCFQQQFNKGIPDFCRPYHNRSIDIKAGQKGSGWFVDDEMRWNGIPSLRMYRRPYKEGGSRTWSWFGAFYPPVTDKPVKMTFSCYARGEKPGARLWIRLVGTIKKVFPLTTEWARYHVTFDLPPGSGRNMGARKFMASSLEGPAVWINGLQIEAGDKPTEFQDDSVLVKKK